MKVSEQAAFEQSHLVDTLLHRLQHISLNRQLDLMSRHQLKEGAGTVCLDL